MTAAWQTKPLGDVCRFVRGPFGGSLKKSVFVEQGYAVYEQQHAIYDQFDEIRYFVDEAKFKEMQRFELHPNDLIMSCSGTMGKVAIVPDNIQPGIINQALLKLTPLGTITSEFLKYWMDSGDFQESLKDQAGGAAIQNVASVSILKEIKVPLPPVIEQHRIVAILDDAFDGVATAKANAEKNLQNARALFESHLQTVFSSRGEGWEDFTLGEVCKFENGDRGKNYPNRSEYVESGIPWINTGHIQPDGTLSDTEMNYISQEKFDSLRGGKIKPGDLVYCLRGATLGKTALVEPLTVGAVASSLVIIRPGKLLNSRFLYYFLTSPVGQSSIKLYENGAAQPNLGANSVAKFVISFPGQNEQKDIVEKIDALAAETQRLESIYQQKISALDELKKSLLHQAFTGKL